MLRIKSLSQPMRRFAGRDNGTLRLDLRRVGTSTMSISLGVVCDMGCRHTANDTDYIHNTTNGGQTARREALAVMRAASPFGLELKQVVFDVAGRDHGVGIGFEERASAALERAALALVLAGGAAPSLQARFYGPRLQVFGLDDAPEGTRRRLRRDLKSALAEAGAVQALWTTTQLQRVESRHQRIALTRELAARRRAAA